MLTDEDDKIKKSVKLERELQTFTFDIPEDNSSI